MRKNEKSPQFLSDTKWTLDLPLTKSGKILWSLFQRKNADLMFSDNLEFLTLKEVRNLEIL